MEFHYTVIDHPISQDNFCRFWHSHMEHGLIQYYHTASLSEELYNALR